MSRSTDVPESPCCVGRNLHGGPDCVWPETTPTDDVLRALGLALWEAIVEASGSKPSGYVGLMYAEPTLIVDTEVTLPENVAEIVGTVVGRVKP